MATPQEKIKELEERYNAQSEDNWPLKILKSEATVAYKQAQMFFNQGKMNIYPKFADRFYQINEAIKKLES